MSVVAQELQKAVSSKNDFKHVGYVEKRDQEVVPCT